MQIHLDLHAQYPLTSYHFQTWLNTFSQTVDDLFEGEIAELTKSRAHSIAKIMRGKMGLIEESWAHDIKKQINLFES